MKEKKYISNRKKLIIIIINTKANWTCFWNNHACMHALLKKKKINITRADADDFD